MVRSRTLSVLLACVAVALALGCGGSRSALGGELSWAKSFEDGMKEAADSGKPVMIDLYTDWCGWCKKLDQDVYTDDKVAELAKEFVCIKLNPEKDPKNGSKFTVEGFPTIIFTDAKGKEVHRVVGYKPAAKFVEEMKMAKEKSGKAAK